MQTDPHRYRRRIAFALIFALAGTAGAQVPGVQKDASSSQAPATKIAYPDRPIKIIVPYAAGAATDTLARLLAKKMSDDWKTPVYVENRPGAGSVIGSQAVARSDADGYTLLMTTNSHVVIPHLQKVPYDAFKDFTPIALIARTPYLLSARKDLPVTSLKDLVALAKATPNKLNWGSGSPGGLSHIGGEYLAYLTGAKFQVIQYKSAAPVIQAALAGEVDIFLMAPGSAAQLLKAGDLKAIAVTGNTRVASLPQVPTMKEAGLPEFDVELSYGIMGPAGMPADIVSKIHLEIRQILSDGAVRKKMETDTLSPALLAPEAYAQSLRAEYKKYGEIIKRAGMGKDAKGG